MDSWGISCTKFEHVCMCLKEEPGIQESCQEFRNPARNSGIRMVAIYVAKLWCIFKMQLCMWCTKKASGIQEYLASAPKITCTQFGTPGSPGIWILCIFLFFLVFPYTFEKNCQEALGTHKFNLCVCWGWPGTGIGDLTQEPPSHLNMHGY